MGCGISKNLSSSSQNGQMRLNAEEIVVGLEGVGRLLAQQRIQAEVIMTGDALRAVHLRTQQTVPYVAIMPDLLTKEAGKALARAAEEVRTLHSNFPPNWLDTGARDVDPNIRQRVAHGALHQDIIVLRNEGLVVYAAPWRYLFVAELDQICEIAGEIKQSSAQAELGFDAAQYLHQVLAPADLTSIDINQIGGWQQSYSYASRSNVGVAFSAVNAAYEQSFGRTPIS